ncbi:MAG: DUF86 domain-containing protein [Spirochaetia bacterium]
MSINHEIVERKISLILQDLEQLQEMAKLDLPEYLADFRNEILAERYLERIIGRVIDINFHIVAEQTLSAPADYYSSFTQLVKLNILDVDSVARYAKLAGLRNRLAHEYNGIDEKMIYKALKDLVADLPRYIEAIKNHIATESG